MKKGLGIALLALVLVTALAISASAVTTVVKPSTMNGWITAAQSPGFSTFRNPCPGNDELVSHSGTGAWYCYTGNAGTVPGQVTIQGSGWIGTNQFAGIRLDRITTLKYSAWTDDCSSLWATRGTAPNLYRQCNPSRQPTVLNLLIDRNDGSGLQSYIMWRPAGSKNSGMPGSVPEGRGNTTQRHWTVWQNDANQFWLEIYDGTLCSWRDNTWGGLLLAYPDATIATSATVGWGWPAFDTPTGCGLNFMYGAEAQSGGGSPVALPGAWQNWWRDAASMRAYIDDFQISIDDGLGAVTDNIFDFEADSVAPEVVCNTRAGLDRVSCGITLTSPWGPALGGDNYTFVLYGEVCADPAPTMFGFYLTDGFKKTEVKCVSLLPDEPPVPYSYVRAHGMLQYDGTWPDGDPAPVDGSGVPLPPDLHSRLLCNRADVTELNPSPF